MAHSRVMSEELANYERPIATQTALLANQNRDPKKQRKPFDPRDFSYYLPRDERNLPTDVYGSAAMLMVRAGRFPSWALFCYKDLAASATEDYIPAMCALVSKDAILLHPVRTNNGWKGMLIAQESASESRRVFTDDEGHEYTLSVPFIETKFVAKEGVELVK